MYCGRRLSALTGSPDGTLLEPWRTKIMKIASLVARLLLGLLFLVFGLNGFLHFFPDGPPMPGLAGQFAGVLKAAHYMIPISALEVVSALLFLANRFVPLGLVLLGPILVNILLFHALVMPTGFQPGVVATALWFVIFYDKRAAFAGIFQAKA